MGIGSENHTFFKKKILEKKYHFMHLKGISPFKMQEIILFPENLNKF